MSEDLTNAAQQGPLYLGVDGGGTGCRARLENAAGEILGAGVAGPATLRLGVEGAMHSVEQAAMAAMAEAGLGESDLPRVHAGIGLAGIGRKGAHEKLVERASPFASVRFAGDWLIACLGAHSGRDGAIVIVGTGSLGIARLGGRDFRVGGYGFPISDEGSGADLGLQAIRFALRAFDGRLEGTPLSSAVLARFDDDPFAIVAWMDKASATDYASFAPLVMRHADDGDPMGRRIVQQAAGEIDALVRAVLTAGAERVALIGGLSSAIEPWLAPDVRRRLKPIDGDAVSGAIRLAREGVNDCHGSNGASLRANAKQSS